MGDATKCEYCHDARIVGWSGAGPLPCPTCSSDMDALSVVARSWREQCAAARYRDAEITRLTAEVATLRARLDDAEARWKAAEAQVEDRGGLSCRFVLRPESTLFRHCDEDAEWSPADRECRCTEHTTREGAEEMTTP